MRERIGCWAYLAIAIGFFFVWAIPTGVLHFPVPAINGALVVIGGLLVLVGGGYALVDGVVTWFQKHFPSKQRRAYITGEAQRLGLRPVDDPASVDRVFPFLGATRGRSPGVWQLTRMALSGAALIAWVLIALIYGFIAASGALDLVRYALILGVSSFVLLGTGWLLGDWSTWFRARSKKRARPGRFTSGALRPGRGPVTHVFAGRWKSIDVRVFDYAYGEDNESQWTCALLPLDASVPDMEVRSVSVGTRLERAIGRPDLAVEDEDFNKAFRAIADDEVGARRVLTPVVRACIVKDAPRGPFLLQLHGKEMLYCGLRVDIGGRGSLLQQAARLRDALARANV